MTVSWQVLYSELTRTDLSCVPEGIHQIKDIYRYVQQTYPSLCDDSIICRDVHKTTHNFPEWKHRVQTALGYRKLDERSRISKPPELKRGYWKCGPLNAAPRRIRDTPEEIVLCTYAAMYNENDFGGRSMITGLHGSSSGSLTMKIFEIASLLDQEGINRETSFEVLPEMLEGIARKNYWKIVEPLLELSKSDFLLLCLNILGGDEFLAESSTQEEYVEGAMRIIYSKRYERNKEARDACIAHYGSRCHVPDCGFDFEAEFGELGKGFIHVHHVKPISERGAEYVVDPINDLIPVCPNCHSMIHRRNTTRDWRNILN